MKNKQVINEALRDGGKIKKEKTDTDEIFEEKKHTNTLDDAYKKIGDLLVDDLKTICFDKNGSLINRKSKNCLRNGIGKWNGSHFKSIKSPPLDNKGNVNSFVTFIKYFYEEKFFILVLNAKQQIAYFLEIFSF